MEQHEVETQLAEAATEVLASAMAVKAQCPTPTRVQALALVLGRKDDKDLIATVNILDIAQRVTCLALAVRKLNGHGFLFLYDGFIDTGAGRQDALLLVTGTRWGAFTASASPYTQAGLGSAFGAVLDVPEAADAYREVFA